MISTSKPNTVKSEGMQKDKYIIMI